MNLRGLKPSRRAPREGDIFALLPPDGEYLFGRLVSVNASVGPFAPLILAYVYRARSREKLRVPQLGRTELLIPPIMTNRLPWSKGYFEVVEHRPLEAGDCLPQHCFRGFQGAYFDEFSNPLSEPTEPVGVRGVSSCGSIDDRISKALGIALSTDD